MHSVHKCKAEVGIARRAASCPLDNTHSVFLLGSHLQSYCLHQNAGLLGKSVPNKQNLLFEFLFFPAADMRR